MLNKLLRREGRKPSCNSKVLKQVVGNSHKVYLTTYILAGLHQSFSKLLLVRPDSEAVFHYKLCEMFNKGHDMT
jgi:hypothetical protein